MAPRTKVKLPKNFGEMEPLPEKRWKLAVVTTCGPYWYESSPEEFKKLMDQMKNFKSYVESDSIYIRKESIIMMKLQYSDA